MEKETYRIGERFTDNYKVDFILSQVAPSQVCLINLQNGNRYEEAVFVEDPYAITKRELKQMSTDIKLTLKPIFTL